MGGVASAGAVVDVVGPDYRPKKFLHVVGVFVDAAGAADAGQRIGTVELFDLLEFFRHHVQGLVPGCLPKGFAFADQGLGEAFGRVDKVIPETSLDAQPPKVGGAFFHGGYLDHPAILDVQPLLAADTAIGTGGAHFFGFAAGNLTEGFFLKQGAGWAGLQTLATVGAVLIVHHGIPSLGMSLAAAVGRGNGRIDLDFIAGLDAAAASDAAAEVAHDHGRGIVQGMTIDGLIDTGHADLVFDGQVLKAAVAMGGTDLVVPGLLHDLELTFTPTGLGMIHEQAVMGARGQHHLQNGLASRFDRRAVGENAHVGSGRRGAGGQQRIAARHFHHADAAPSGGLGVLQMTQCGDDHIVFPGHLQDGLSRFKRNGSIVQTESRHG